MIKFLLILDWLKLKNGSAVFINIKISDGNIFIKIEDQGQGYDFKHINDPLDKFNIKKECGRGLFFIKQLSDSCEVTGDGRIILVTLKVK